MRERLLSRAYSATRRRRRTRRSQDGLTHKRKVCACACASLFCSALLCCEPLQTRRASSVPETRAGPCPSARRQPNQLTRTRRNRTPEAAEERTREKACGGTGWPSPECNITSIYRDPSPQSRAAELRTTDILGDPHVRDASEWSEQILHLDALGRHGQVADKQTVLTAGRRRDERRKEESEGTAADADADAATADIGGGRASRAAVRSVVSDRPARASLTVGVGAQKEGGLRRRTRRGRGKGSEARKSPVACLRCCRVCCRRCICIALLLPLRHCTPALSRSFYLTLDAMAEGGGCAGSGRGKGRDDALLAAVRSKKRDERTRRNRHSSRSLAQQQQQQTHRDESGQWGKGERKCTRSWVCVEFRRRREIPSAD